MMTAGGGGGGGNGDESIESDSRYLLKQYFLKNLLTATSSCAIAILVCLIGLLSHPIRLLHSILILNSKRRPQIEAQRNVQKITILKVSMLLPQHIYWLLLVVVNVFSRMIN